MSGVRPSVAAVASAPCAQRTSDGRPAATARTWRGRPTPATAPLGPDAPAAAAGLAVDTAAGAAELAVGTAPGTAELAVGTAWLAVDTAHGAVGTAQHPASLALVTGYCAGDDLAGNGRARIVALCHAARGRAGCRVWSHHVARYATAGYRAAAAGHHGVTRRCDRSSGQPRRATGAARVRAPRCAAREADERIDGRSVGVRA